VRDLALKRATSRSGDMRKHSKTPGKILVVDDNPTVLKLLGTLLAEEGMGVTLAASVPEARAALAAERGAFDLVLSDISMPGETGFDLLQWIKQDGSPYRDLPVLLTTAQLPEAENRIKGLAMGAVDYVVRPIELSELVLRAIHAIEHFQRVRSLERSLQDSENLAMVGRLLAASHHEIKNLALLVHTSAEQTIKRFGGVGDSQAQTCLAALAQSTELLTDVARSVSTLLTPEGAVCRPFDLTVLVQDVTRLVEPQVRPCWIDAREASAIWAAGHPVRAKQILINLLLNAADAIRELDPEDGGRITVTVESDGESRKVVVKDNGIGFEKSQRSDFKAFATTKKLRGGQGLGLWLCSKLAQNMGGSLTLSSDGVRQGATAVLTLPASAAADDLDIEKYLRELD